METINSLELIANLSKNGIIKLKPEQKELLDSIIESKVIPSQNDSNYNNFCELIDIIEDGMNQEQIEKNRIKSLAIKDVHSVETDKLLTKKVLNDLLIQGVNKDIVDAIGEVSNNYFSEIPSDAIKLIEPLLNESKSLDKDVLYRIVFDSINQKDGAKKDLIRIVSEMNVFVYIGNTCEDSRPICTHIKEKFDGRITVEELKEILNEYCPNGIPSDEIITYSTINGVVRTTTKGSGMIKGTTYENFAQYRGGEGCRHSANPTRLKR